ncbi:unnamed protein product [Mytilus edulis]|uniref:Protein kinase domain-containing protein n=1 Tax=Mytilus edulis TaxID=6550 RepID=A0A8S3S4V2_MYTED|nr:unnamed protein product [Mytilus edulis]
MANLDDDEIDKLKLPAAVKLAKQREIDITGLRDLEEIKCQLKKYLLTDRRNRESVIQELMVAAEEDSKVRHELMEIYEKTIKSLDFYSHEDPLIRSVSKGYRNINVLKMLLKQKGKLDGKISRCPVLVLGDTGAGKSSFINLLLGQEVFPCSLLSNTSVICEISYSELPYATLYPHEDEGDTVQPERISSESERMEDFDFTRLSQLVQQRDEEKKRSSFQKAEIGFPLPILKTGLIIVDSPGVGDTPEMTKLVLDYIMEASAFVFIINTIDGVQITRLEMLLAEIADRVMTENKYYKQDCTLFVCNKWDQVPIDERDSVREDALKKLKKVWIGFQPSHLYTLSTKEALWIQKDGLIVGRFEKILQGIINLLPPSREQLLTTSTGKLFDFLNNCMTCIENNIQKSTISVEEAERQQTEVNTRMKELKAEVNEFFDHQKSGLKSNLSKIAESLSKYLRTEDVKKDLGSFKATDPEFYQKNFQDVSVIIRSRVYDGISKHMKTWEEEQKQLEDIGKQLLKKFNEKFPDFEAQLFRVEKLFRNTWRGDTGEAESPMDEKIPLVPDIITDRYTNLNLGLKVILSVALTPVFLIGAIVRLPYWGLRHLGNVIKNEMLHRSFEKGNDKDKVIKEYTQNVINKMTEKMVIDACFGSQLSILYHYIDHQKQKVIEQIDRKLAMLNESAFDHSEPFNATWHASMATVEVLLKNVEYFNMMFLPQNLHFESLDRFEVTDVLSEGVLTKIVLARDTKKNNELIAIRQTQMSINIDMIKQYQKEERYYRKTNTSKHDKRQIIIVDTFVKHNMHVWQCFQRPRQSLRQFIKEKQYKEYDDTKLKFYYKTLSQVTKGLKYLHERGMVHIDLCQDTIMIDKDGKVVLVNISCPTLLDKSLFSPDITSVADYVHFSADIMTHTDMTVYEKKHDIYSLGILMWELWSQENAFSRQIKQHSITNLRHFSEYLRGVDIQSCLPSVSKDESITSLVKTWHDVMSHCLELKDELTAAKWLDSFTYDLECSEFSQSYTGIDNLEISPHIYSRMTQAAM